jgi:hypothetical protein
MKKTILGLFIPAALSGLAAACVWNVTDDWRLALAAGSALYAIVLSIWINSRRSD